MIQVETISTNVHWQHVRLESKGGSGGGSKSAGSGGI